MSIQVKPYGTRGKFMVTQVINGRVFRNIMDKEAADKEIARHNARPQLTPAEIAERSIPFGSPGYRG